MKIEQEEPKGLSKLAKTLTDSGKKISDAWQEAKQQIAEADNAGISLYCLQKDKVDFNLIEKDINRLHQKLSSEGSSVLGSHIVIDGKKDYLEIRTYIQQGEKTLLDTVKFKAKSISNLPSDVYKKLQEQGKVELHFS